MRLAAILLMFLVICVYAKSQQALPDSLKKDLEQAHDDSVLFKTLRPIYTFYEETNRDSALHYAKLRYEIVKKHHRNIEEAYLLGQIAYQQIYLGRFSEALANLTAAFQIAEKAKDANTWELTPFNTAGKSRQITLSMLNHMYGHLKLQTGNMESLHYFREGRRIGLEIGNNFRVTVADMVLASNYLLVKQPDSALFFAKEGEAYGIRGGIGKYVAYIYSVLGDIYLKKGSDSIALAYYYKSLQYAVKESNFTVVGGVYQNLINYYYERNIPDSMLFYARKNIAVVSSLGAVTSFVTSDNTLGKAYQYLAFAYSLKKNTDSTNRYLLLSISLKDSITAVKLKRLAAFQRLTLDEQVRLQDEEKKRVEAETRRRTYLLISGIAVALIISLLIYRNSRQKQKAFKLLQKQKAETDLQKVKADIALQDLKAAQSQLIQSEKMASLGELTAGIAHEIQNPLNFVNNFSELSNELIDEMNAEIDKGDIGEAKAISADIKQNLEKINHHGKRADSIVKGMLQHSQSSVGTKELTDINKLTDEYLRLCYHGLRAKNNSLNTTINTDFETDLPMINVVPQDIGRVILNVLTNAFYAANEKKKGSSNFEPIITVSTRKIADAIQIRISDNGNGIPPNIIDKIFQPFFTTKPTGEGTGLGLSLSYDIITKGHGGELKVETNLAEGTAFIIRLNIQ